MPWFPDFVAAVELARIQTRAVARADPVSQYLRALDRGDSRELEIAWPGEIVVHDPYAGEVRGHQPLQRFVRRNSVWMAEHHVSTETVASTRVPGRAVVELVAHVPRDGTKWAWPVAVVAASDDDLSVEFRTYCSQEPLDGQRHVRPPILRPGPAPLGDVVGRYQAALATGDAEAIVDCFTPDGYVREPVGPPYRHRGPDELRAFFTTWFGAGGGISLEQCAVTDDGVRCALEYNCVGWGSRELPPQAGLAVYERADDGRLAAVRIYDDIEPPAAVGDR